MPLKWPETCILKRQLIAYHLDSGIVLQKLTFYVPDDHSCFGEEGLWLAELKITGRASTNDIARVASLHNCWTLNEIRTKYQITFKSEERSLLSTLYGLSCYYSERRNKVNKINRWIGIYFLLIYTFCAINACCVNIMKHVCSFSTFRSDYLWARTWFRQRMRTTEKKWESVGFQYSPICKGIEKSGRKKCWKRLSCGERAFNVWALGLWWYLSPHIQTPVPDKYCMRWCKKAEFVDSAECFTENKFMHRRHL